MENFLNHFPFLFGLCSLISTFVDTMNANAPCLKNFFVVSTFELVPRRRRGQVVPQAVADTNCERGKRQCR